MSVVYERFGVTVHEGDCLDVLPTLPDQSVDAVITDPPYELAFMGRAWDSSGIAFNTAVWTECLRVLKPGGHILAFGGSRTWHRLACAIEDTGFELRDSIAWLYGNGFPKSLDVSKAIDRGRDDRTAILRVTAWLADARDQAGLTNQQIDAVFGFDGMARHWTTQLATASVPPLHHWERLRELLCFGGEMDDEVQRLNDRKGTEGNPRVDRVVSERGWNEVYQSDRHVLNPGTPVLDEATQWKGWGTALKPAFEPIVVGRKPLTGTVAATVLTYGTGALNIDACRTPAGQDYREKCASVVGLDSNRNGDAYGEWTGARVDSAHVAGRWPTNVVLDGLVARELDEEDRASRFFPVFRWEAKASSSERPRVADVSHPTVKPLALMRWLVRLVTPPAGVVLDPFLGSGTTAQAVRAEGFRCIGIEREPSYIELIRARLDARPPQQSEAAAPVPQTLDLLDLLDEGGAA